MNTLRKFITYYSPYKTVFFIDIHQHCRSCLPADPARADKYFVYERQQSHPSCAPIHCSRTSFHVSYTKSLQILCKLPGTYDGRLHGT